MKATHYYEWGGEMAGHVSTYYWDANDDFVACGQMPREEAYSLGLKFNCPFP